MAFTTRLTPAMAARWRGAGLWSDETFASALAARVRATPEREALTDGTRRVNYRELADGIDRMATRLRALGIAAGDVVTIQLPNWIEFAFVFFALERLGAVAVTVSVDFRSRELEYIMRFAGSKMFVCCGQFRGFDHAAMAAELAPRLPSLAAIGIVGGTAPANMVSLDDVVAARGAPVGFAPVPMDADTVMRMAFTSGTTGNPKGVMHSHNTTLAAARILNGDLGLSADDVMMIWLPLGLNWGYLTLVQSVLAGAKAVLLDRFAPSAALDLIARERVTYIPTAPASLTAILAEPDLGRRDLSSLRIVVSGGASAPVETIRTWRRAVLASEASGQRGHSEVRAHSASEDARKRADDTRSEPGLSARRAVLASEASGQHGHSISARAGHSPEPGSSARRAVLASEASGQHGHSISARAGHSPEPGSSARAAPGALLELLGMLETGYQAYTRPGDDPERVAGSVGVPASHMGLRLVDSEGRDVPQGEEGEICCDGPSVHLGYHNNPSANAEAFLPDGWFRSGDLGMIDPDGRLRIVGRLKEMINRGGKKFFPREIEEILYTHPQVLYAAIVGIPDARLGERNCLCLVPRPGEPPTLESITAFLGDSVATYKLPERLELFTQFPFTPTGKIQRHALVREVLARMSAA
jgi:acyl-CoA synthetase (AMP-forming)/AMP-acid ligase II